MTTSIKERKYIVKKVFAGAGFRISGFVVTRLISIIRIIVFARIFLPDELGTVALAVSCVSIMSVFSNFGFFQSVIRARENQTNIANTAFSLSLFVGMVLSLLTFIGAPVFSKIFSTDLNAYLRFLSFMVLSIPLQFPKVFWEKKLEFGHPTIAQLIPESLSFITALFLEIGFHLGIWSLLIGHAVGFLCSGLYLWALADFRPHVQIERESVAPLMSFGLPLMLQGVNGFIMQRGDNLMVGAFCGVTQLAYYNFAWQLPFMISSLTSSIDSMLFPVYARLNSSEYSINKLFNMTNKMWSITGSFLGFPIILYTDTIVHTLYGPNWDPVIPILKVMALSFIIRFCTGYSYDNIALVRGRTLYMMKWGFVNTFLVFTMGLFMIRKMGPIGGAWFWVFQAIVLIPLVRLPLIYQELHSLTFLKHIWQPILSGVTASLCAYACIELLVWSDLTKLTISVIGYFLIFPISLFILDKQLVRDITSLISLTREQ